MLRCTQKLDALGPIELHLTSCTDINAICQSCLDCVHQSPRQLSPFDHPDRQRSVAVYIKDTQMLSKRVASYCTNSYHINKGQGYLSIMFATHTQSPHHRVQLINDQWSLQQTKASLSVMLLLIWTENSSDWDRFFSSTNIDGDRFFLLLTWTGIDFFFYQHRLG